MNSTDRARQFQVNTKTEDDITTIALTGELDIATADSLANLLESTKVESGAQLVIDLQNVDFMDSTGLRLLIRANRRANEGGYSLIIVTGGSPAKRVLELTRMDEHMQVVPQLDLS